MTGRAHKGCAGHDGLNFRDWFVGPLSSWTVGDSLEIPPLRQSEQVQVKWSAHPAGSRRTGEWAVPDGHRSLCILLEGKLTFFFRSPSEPDLETKYLLESPGEYVIWEGQIEHLWASQKDSRVLTIRWKEDQTA